MDLKAALKNAQWRFHDNATVDLNGEPFAVVIRRPPENFVLSAMEDAKEAKEVDAASKPTSERNGLRLLARLTRMCLFAPGGVVPLFQPDELEDVVNAPWLADLAGVVTSAIGGTKALVEAAKGKSEATPT